MNCVDRHFRNNPHKVALIWEKDEPGMQEYITYETLYHQMNKIANMLKSHGVQKGDSVALYIQACPLAVASMLACARIGAIHSVVFAGFSVESLASRINDAQCKCIITANQGVRGGKIIELKKTVDEVVKKCPSLKQVYVFNRTNLSYETNEVYKNLEEEMKNYDDECEPEQMESEDALFILYTSGSTGKPKGVIHTQAGYLLGASLSQKLIFHYNFNDIFGCMADIGWITGHTYVVYGPLSNGGTSILFESTPTYPDAGRYWETVERLKINQFYTAPTAIRLLIRYSNEHVTKYKRTSLKLLGSVGEPINKEAWYWYNDVVGEKRLKIADTWWQTETGSILISPTPCAINDLCKPGMPMKPFFGIQPVLLDDKGKELSENGKNGSLCIKKPWPSMARTINGDHKRYLDTYLKPFPGYFFTGDGALTDNDGHFQIIGRIDDVINTSGHRIGSAELEDILNSHSSVAESAVVACPHDIKGEGIFAYVSLKENTESNEDCVISELKLMVKSSIASFAVPDYFLVNQNLPKTRSGKIMRRVLRLIAEQRNDFGDITTIADPACIQQIIDKYNQLKKPKNF